MYWVYILHCADQTLYTGSTPRLESRVREHNAGKGAKYTRGRRPVWLGQAWLVENRRQALRLEAFIKRFSHKAKEQFIHDPQGLVRMVEEKGYDFKISLVNSAADKFP